MRRGVAGLTAVVILLVVVVLLRFSKENTSAGEKPARARPEGKPVAMPANLAGVRIKLGLKDTKATPWDGEVQLWNLADFKPLKPLKAAPGYKAAAK